MAINIKHGETHKLL